MKKHFIFLTLLFLVVFGSCSRNKGKIPQANIGKVPEVNVKIHRYGEALFRVDTAHFAEGLKNIHGEFSFFLGENLDNRKNIKQLLDYVSDTQIISIYHRTMKVFPDLKDIKSALDDAFGRYKYFFPGLTIPSVYTYVSDIYYEQPVMKKDTVVVIALDDYLGTDFPLYGALAIPRYHIRCMQPANIPVDVMKTMYDDDLIVPYRRKTLLDHMISDGKQLVYLDAIFPAMSDTLKICYTAKQLQWALDHEKEIWGFLIENKFLYSSDFQMISKLMQDGPFTNGFGKQSPSRLGSFVGWHIVRKFMVNNPDVTVREMIGMNDSQSILEGSRYKP